MSAGSQAPVPGIFSFFFTLLTLQSFLRHMGKLPTHRSLYLLRFHPYARVKPSARERAMAARYTSDPDGLFSDEQRVISSYQTMIADSNHSLIIARGLDNAVNVTHSVEAHLQNLSVSILVADLAVLMCRTPSPTGRP